MSYGPILLRPWARNWPAWALHVYVMATLPLFLLVGSVVGAVYGATQGFAEWRDGYDSARAAIRVRDRA